MTIAVIGRRPMYGWCGKYGSVESLAVDAAANGELTEAVTLVRIPRSMRISRGEPCVCGSDGCGFTTDRRSARGSGPGASYTRNAGVSVGGELQ